MPRCKNGTRKNKKTGVCEKKIDKFLPQKTIKQKMIRVDPEITRKRLEGERWLKRFKLVKDTLRSKIAEYKLDVNKATKQEKKNGKEYQDSLYVEGLAERKTQEEEKEAENIYLQHLPIICHNIKNPTNRVFAFHEAKHLLSFDLTNITYSEYFTEPDTYHVKKCKIILDEFAPL
jgi:hypothetical protein